MTEPDRTQSAAAETTVVTEMSSTTSGSMTVTEVTSLVQLFNNSLLATEGRLSVKIDEGAVREAARWKQHEVEVALNKEVTDQRFDKLWRELKSTADALEAHLQRERDEDLVSDARVKPVLTVVQYVAKNWKTILLIIVSMLAIIGFSFETLEKFITRL